jgi:para-nitrobenzyl esterase
MDRHIAIEYEFNEDKKFYVRRFLLGTSARRGGISKDLNMQNRLKTLTALVVGAIAQSAAASVYDENRPVVEIRDGKLQGVEEYGMLAFKNIPYAAPPVGELRWRPPQSVSHWQGVRDASRFGQACLQPFVKGLNSELVPGSEDCLKLNVFAPNSAQNLPVMVWFHGGALISGSAAEPYYEPINLTRDGVVVVTVDYRLGKLGFFAPKELAEEARKNSEPVGNYGTMDQIEALKWVRENIRSFGGDPDNVTIFGQSAGGRSVTWLMTSPAAKGLFHKAIAESAQQLPLRGQTEERHGLVPEEAMDAKFEALLGATDLKRLRSLPADKLVLTPQEFQDGVFGGSFIDGQIIIGDPIPLFAEGQQYKVPFMIGTNSWDASFFVISQPPLDDYLKKMGEDPQIIEKLYASFRDKCALPAEVMADGWYRGGVKLLADSAGKKAPSYAYYFDYLTPSIRASHPGAAHTFELPYVFGSMAFVLSPPATPESGVDQCGLIGKAAADLKERATWASYWFPIADANSHEDQLMSEQIAKSWAAFAKTGNPNTDGSVMWPTYNLKIDVMRDFSQVSNTLIKSLEKDRVDYQIKALTASYRLN